MIEISIAPPLQSPQSSDPEAELLRAGSRGIIACVGTAPTISDVLRSLGERAPWQKAGSWDPVGLQLGDPTASAARTALCHEVTEETVRVLEAEPVDFLVSYHPLLFEPTTRLVAGSDPPGRALRLLQAGIALAVVHTNFDVAAGGTADALADALGLEDVQGFAPLFGPDTLKVVTFVPAASADDVLDAVVRAGAGAIGNYTHCSYRSEGVGTFFAGAGTQPVAGASGALNREPELRLEFVAPRAREAAENDRISVRAMLDAGQKKTVIARPSQTRGSRRRCNAAPLETRPDSACRVGLRPPPVAAARPPERRLHPSNPSFLSARLRAAPLSRSGT